MPVDRKLLEILVCPITKQSLSILSESKLDRLNKNITEESVKNQSGDVIKKSIVAALITGNGKTIYPVVDNIPVMLESESIATVQFSDWI